MEEDESREGQMMVDDEDDVQRILCGAWKRWVVGAAEYDYWTGLRQAGIVWLSLSDLTATTLFSSVSSSLW